LYTHNYERRDMIQIAFKRLTRELSKKVLSDLSSIYIKFVLSILFKFTQRIEEELDGSAVNALRRAIAEVKQRWSVICMGDQKCNISSSSVLRKAR
jgi:hypothetical protein